MLNTPQIFSCPISLKVGSKTGEHHLFIEEYRPDPERKCYIFLFVCFSPPSNLILPNQLVNTNKIKIHIQVFDCHSVETFGGSASQTRVLDPTGTLRRTGNWGCLNGQ